MDDINAKIMDDGLNVNIDMEQKLIHLWRCYCRSKSMADILRIELAQVRYVDNNDMGIVGRNISQNYAFSDDNCNDKQPTIERQETIELRRNETNEKNEERFCISKAEKENALKGENELLKKVKVALEKNVIKSAKKLKEAKETINDMQKQIEVERMNQKHELKENTKYYEDALAEAFQKQEMERQTTNKIIIVKSKLEIDHRMQKHKLDKMHDEILRFQELLKTIEKENSEMKDEISEMHCLNERNKSELKSTKEEQAKDISALKEALLHERSLMESSYLEKIHNLSKEKELTDVLLKDIEDRLIKKIDEAKNQEIRTEGMMTKLDLKEQEIKLAADNLKEREKKIASLNVQLGNALAEKTRVEKIVKSKKEQSQEDAKKIADLRKRYEDLELLFKTTEEHRLELGKKLVNSCGELASSQECINQLKSDIETMSLQMIRQENTSLQEQERLKMVIKNTIENFEKERNIKEKSAMDFENSMRKLHAEKNERQKIVTTMEEEAKDMSETIKQFYDSENELKIQLDREGCLRIELQERANELERDIERYKQTNAELIKAMKAADQSRINYKKEADIKSMMIQQSDETIRYHKSKAESHLSEIEQLTDQLRITKETAQKNRLESQTLKDELDKCIVNFQTLAARNFKLENVIKENGKLQNATEQQLMGYHVSGKLQSDVIAEINKQSAHLEQLLEEKQNEIECLLKTMEIKDESINVLEKQIKTLRRKIKPSRGSNKVYEVNEAVSAELELLKEENGALKMELYATNEVVDELRKKEELSVSGESLIQTYNERYAREMKAVESTMSQLKRNLEITQERLEQELEWKSCTEAELRKIKEEKSNLISQISKLEEEVSHLVLENRKGLITVEHLEKANTNLQNALEQQLKHILHISKQENIIA